jgi:Leucine-rich repeat (LRR) protein
MRGSFLTRLSLGILALCLCTVRGGEIKAQCALMEGVFQDVTERKADPLKSMNSDYAESSGVQSADGLFESFAQALLTPEKVRRLVVKEFDPEIKHLPPGLGTFTNLEELEMSCLEKLEDLPDEIGKLRKLESLIIDNGNGCQMNISLPRSIGKLENLRVLTLYGALDPRDIGSEQSLRPSKFKRLPPTIAGLRNLEELDLGRNGLQAIPIEIATLHKLKSLRLDYNDIRELPSAIGNLRNLQELSLRSNGGINLPRSLAALKGLKVHMGNNALKLKDQQKLRNRFPNLSFSFDNEFDDEAANETFTAPKSKARIKRKR